MTIESQAAEIIKAMPDEMVARITASRNAGDDARFEAGWLSAELLDELGDKYAKGAVRRAVGLMYHVTDGTIRNQEMTARIVSREMREAHPLLTFHYWTATIKDGAVDMDMVMQIEEHEEAYGMIPPVATVRMWAKDNGVVKKVWVSRVESIISTIEKIVEDEGTPEQVVIFLNYVSHVLDVML